MDHGHSTLRASLSLGYISGQPPLFERFTLGDTSTLRGWNKFDIAPAGGDRMWHQSLEYRFHAGAVFLDAGSVWDHSAEQRARLSAGFGIHVDNFFLLGGFPLNVDNGGGIFMVGVRF
jgi:outer membrane protein assembly factor BamA